MLRQNQAHDQAMQTCIDHCQRCHSVCLQTVTHCLTLGGRHAAAAHIRLLLDCAEICQTSANFMLRQSEFHAQTCGVCAEICQQCADDCARFADDQMMQQCVQSCRQCAESCQQMAGMGVPA